MCQRLLPPYSNLLLNSFLNFLLPLQVQEERWGGWVIWHVLHVHTLNYSILYLFFFVSSPLEPSSDCRYFLRWVSSYTTHYWSYYDSFWEPSHTHTHTTHTAGYGFVPRCLILKAPLGSWQLSLIFLEHWKSVRQSAEVSLCVCMLAVNHTSVTHTQ